MGLSKQFMRYVSAGQFNCICSPGCNPAVVNPDLCAVAACQNIYFWNIRKGEKVTQISSSEQISVLSFSPDRRLLAVGFANGNINIFDRNEATDVPKVVFSGHKSPVNCISFSKDGLLLASGGKDCAVIVWDIVNEAGLFRLNGHKGVVTRLRFARGNKYLISSSKDMLLKFWNLNTQSCFYTITHQRTEVYDFVLLKEDTQLIVGAVELELSVFALNWLQDGEETEQLTEEVKRLKTEPGEQQDSIEDQANTIVRCHKIGSLLRQSKGRVNQLILRSDEALLMCMGIGDIVDVYRIYSTDEIERRIQKKIRKAKKRANEGEHIELESLQRDVPNDISTQIVRIGQHKCEAKPKSAAFMETSTDGTFSKVLFILSNNSLQSTNLTLLKSGEFTMEKGSSITNQGHRTDIRSVKFSHDDFALLTASDEGVKVWNRHSMLCVQTVECKHVLDALFVTGDRHAVVATKTGEILLLDLSAAEIMESIEAHTGSVWAMHLTPDLKGFATASADKTVKFWNFELVSEEQKKRLSVVHSKTLDLSEEALCVRFSSNHKFVAVGLLDNTAKVFFVDTLKFFLSLYGHSLPVLCLDISYDNALIVTGSADKNVKIWGLDFGDCHRSIFAHDDSVTSVRFVPKSHLFFSAGKDGLIKQWDGDKFEKIQVLKGHAAQVWAVDVSANGRFLVTAGHDKSVRLWEKSEEILVVQEEQEQEREHEYEQSLADKEDVVAGELADTEAAMATRKNVESVKSAENILEAVEICRNERIARMEDSKHQPHPLITAMGSASLDRFILDVIRKIRSSDLEKCLLMVPFGFVLDILTSLAVCVSCGYQLELACRVVLFLTRIHHNQLLASSEALPVIDKLRSTMPPKVNDTRDMLGFNLAALQLMQLDMEEKDEIQLFAEISEKVKAKKKKKKQAFVMTVA